MDDSYFMKIALQEALAAQRQGEVPIGAVVTVNDKVIAKAHNLTETLNDVTAHAEMQAITAAAEALGGKYLTDCTLYVTVEPCAMCASALGWAQIGRIVFGAADDKRGYRRMFGNERGPLHPHTQLTSGVLAEECGAIMTDFFRNMRAFH